MDRRSFLRGSIGIATGLGLAGCLGGSSPPPRRAQVFSDVELQGTTMQIDLSSQPQVESRIEDVQDAALSMGGAGVAGSLSPIGVARAAKGAGNRGAGGYASAPRGRHGWAVWHGGAYSDDWRDNHRDDLRMYAASVAVLGVAYLGTDNEYENDPPGPGPQPWDKKWQNPNDGAAKQVDIGAISPGSGPQEGWYRVGTKLVAKNENADFGFQGADFEIDNEGNWIVDKAWHVKPRV
jgi:hypothetical protein